MATPADATPKVHVLAETTLGSHDRLTAGTAIGEPRGVQIGRGRCLSRSFRHGHSGAGGHPGAHDLGNRRVSHDRPSPKRPRLRPGLPGRLPAQKEGRSATLVSQGSKLVAGAPPPFSVPIAGPEPRLAHEKEEGRLRSYGCGRRRVARERRKARPRPAGAGSPR